MVLDLRMVLRVISCQIPGTERSNPRLRHVCAVPRLQVCDSSRGVVRVVLERYALFLFHHLPPCVGRVSFPGVLLGPSTCVAT